MNIDVILPQTIRDEAQAEAYEFFDKKVRPLQKDNSGKVDPSAHGLEDNDADAFRHAYVSAVFTQEYGENAARIFGNMNEMDPLSIYSRTSNPGTFKYPGYSVKWIHGFATPVSKRDSQATNNLG